jgi:predicted Zn-dependent protease
MALGKFETAAEEAKKAIEHNPDHVSPYGNLAANYVYRNHLPEAQSVLQQASKRKLDKPEFLVLRYQIAFLRDDQAEMERLAALGEQRSGLDDWICDQEACVLAYYGRLQQARSKSRRATDLARQSGHRERAAQHEAGAAVREILFGYATEAQRRAAKALDLSNGRDAEYGAALALALSRDSSRSQRLADDLEGRFSEDTLATFSYLPALRALLALNHQEPSKAIELLQAAAPFELGAHGSSSVGFIGPLYSIYVRGEAYLKARQGVEAASEFQKILDHRGIVRTDLIGALAHLELGRAFVLSGDKSKAKTAYQDFLTLWKDADPDVPILKQAKAEYARL